jgi:recombinase-like zinc beta ribbon protein
MMKSLGKCATCGSSCTGQSAIRRDKKYHYYMCHVGSTKNFGTGGPHKPPYVKASWLEELVWTDVRRFLEDPQET